MKLNRLTLRHRWRKCFHIIKVSKTPILTPHTHTNTTLTSYAQVLQTTHTRSETRTTNYHDLAIKRNVQDIVGTDKILQKSSRIHQAATTAATMRNSKGLKGKRTGKSLWASGLSKRKHSLGKPHNWDTPCQKSIADMEQPSSRSFWAHNISNTRIFLRKYVPNIANIKIIDQQLDIFQNNFGNINIILKNYQLCYRHSLI